MAKRAGKKASDIIVWIILALLMVGLAGFGIGSFGTSAVEVGRVGTAPISARQYARALQAELRAQAAEGGQFTSLSAMRAAGLDRAVLDGLVARAALTHEAEAMGVSVGDEEVARQIRNTTAFQGPGGAFDRSGYEFLLQQQGFTTEEFEETVREDISRSLLQSGVVGGLEMPAGFIEPLLAYQTETRSFTLARVTEDDLATGLTAPTQEELQAYYDENQARFERPEARAITYAWITPDMIMDDVSVDETALRALYDERIAQYVQPERRLLERLVLTSEEEANSAIAALEAGETEFDILVAERGLTLEDIDLGEVSADEISDAAAEVIFADTEREIFGPLESAFGPALYRVNAVLDASEITFEDAQDDLRDELAEDAARRAIDAMIEQMDDLLASGATLEELAAETGMVLDTVTWREGADTGIAAYDDFREAAATVSETDFPELLPLSDGGQFALRLDEVIPASVPPLDEITDEVTQAWRDTQLRERLTDRAQSLITQLATSGSLEDLDLELQQEELIRRNDFIPDAPPTLVAQIYQLNGPGDLVVIPASRSAWIARLDSINSGTEGAADTVALRAVFEAQGAQAMAQDLFEAYGQALQAEIGISLDQGVINAVHAQFP